MATRLIIEQGLKKAIEDTCMAVEATTAQSPERATMMIHLGDRLNTRHTFRGDPSDFEEASSYWPSAMEFENAPIRIRLIAADQCLPAVNLLEDLKRVYQIAHAGGVPLRVYVTKSYGTPVNLTVRWAGVPSFPKRLFLSEKTD